MTQIPQNNKKREVKYTSPKAVVLREEFVALTHDPLVAIVLNQLLYWTQRVKDFDLLLEEEQFFNPDCNISPRHGWIYKTANDLAIETMICVDRTTMRRYLKVLMEQGWLEGRSNPHNKWDKTSQYRLNLRKLQEDLWPLDFELPGINLLTRKEFIKKEEQEDASEIEESSNVQNAPSNGAPSDEQNALSNASGLSNSPLRGYTSPSEEQIALSERSNSPFLSTEIITEIKNRDHSQRTCTRENFSDFENSKNFELENSSSEKFASDESVAEEMIRIWEYHVMQKLDPENWQGVLHLTVTRKDQLESLFAFHFQNDIRLWERFCLRVKASNFLMGGGPNGWKVTLDWIFHDSNLLKILEGNFDDSNRFEQQGSSHEWDLAKMPPNPARDAEKAAIIDSIKDPVWREWCSRLALGTQLNELQMREPPLSLGDLRHIANAQFLECEDERLIWVGSSDPCVLNKIEDLRLKMTWVFEQYYPKARTIRTRLLEEHPLERQGIHPCPLSTQSTQQQGDSHHV